MPKDPCARMFSKAFLLETRLEVTIKRQVKGMVACGQWGVKELLKSRHMS